MRIATFAAAGALLLAAHTLLADTPGGRAETRMVYDPASTHLILYGGATSIDKGTKVSYDLEDTWEFIGDRWIRRYTAHTAGPRSGHVMWYDSNRSRIVLFGGRRYDVATKTQTVRNDTWMFKNGDWTEIVTPNAPPPRTVAGGAFDPVRDRFVLFGGNLLSTDGKNTITTTHDTWEFDGTTWTQRAGEGPKVSKPILVYDDAHHQIIMLGLDEDSTSKTATLMYTYDSAAGTWSQIKPEGLPPCVNEAHVAFDGETNSVILVGGVCNDSGSDDETFSWDGTKWTKLDIKTVPDRAFGGAIAYDPIRETLYQYGGTIAFESSRLKTVAFHDGDWATVLDTFSPGPRSLPVVFTVPELTPVFLYGGIDETLTHDDFWSWSAGQWTFISGDNRPSSCFAPVGTYDTDRKKYVMVCNAGNVWEFDGTTWKNSKDLKEVPPPRRFSSISYDPTLKKTVLYGGYDELDFIDQTWTWDGAVWTRVKKNPAKQRGQAAMWYDASLKKTVLYGGIGRQDRESRIERFADMWTFDGTGWTKMKIEPTATPGMRYGMSTAVDPRNGHLLLFGGLVYTKDANDIESQFYTNDMWEWDGAKWTKLTTTAAPEIRENSGFVYDPVRDRMVLFGGYGGHYYGDLWLFDTTKSAWQNLFEAPSGNRRRPAPTPQPPAGGSVIAQQQ